MSRGNYSHSCNVPYSPYIYTSYYKKNLSKEEQKVVQSDCKLEESIDANIIHDMYIDYEENDSDEKDIRDLFSLDIDKDSLERELENGLVTLKESVMKPTDKITNKKIRLEEEEVMEAEQEPPIVESDGILAYKKTNKEKCLEEVIEAEQEPPIVENSGILAYKETNRREKRLEKAEVMEAEWEPSVAQKSNIKDSTYSALELLSNLKAISKKRNK